MSPHIAVLVPCYNEEAAIAKVVRDRIMDALADSYPGYGWEHNRGYATTDHRNAILKLGVTAHHRRTFAAVRMALEGTLQPAFPFEDTGSRRTGT